MGRMDFVELPVGEWSYIAFTYNGAGLGRFFLNGDLEHSSDLDTGDIPTSENPLAVGETNPDRFLLGDLAQIAVYDRALTTQEREDVEAHLTGKWLDAGVTANIDQTAPAYAQSAESDASVSGEASQSAPAFTQATTADVTVSGTASQTAPAFSQAAAGDVATPGVDGAIAQAAPAYSQQTEADVTVSG